MSWRDIAKAAAGRAVRRILVAALLAALTAAGLLPAEPGEAPLVGVAEAVALPLKPSAS